MLFRVVLNRCSFVLAFFLIHNSVNAQSDANQWTWIGGDSSNASLLTDQLGQWGTKGVASTSNYPSARTRAVSWTDGQGNYWLFGGRGYDGAGNNGLLNDLWKYNPTTKEWTWVSGDNAVNTLGVYTGSVKPGGRQGAIGWTDTTGNLWLFSGNGFASYPANTTIASGFLNDLWKYDVATNSWNFVRGSNRINTSASGSPAPREASVSWPTTDGKLWMMGGSTQNGRINDLWNYDPSTNTWSFLKGCTCFDQRGTYGSIGVSSSSNVPGARQDAISFTDNEGNLWLFGGQGRDIVNSFGFLNDLWKYDVATNEWTWFKGSDKTSQAGVYGTKGIAASSNTPGARSGGVGWTDANGRFYLYGGAGSSSFSDVWVYDPSTGLWTWKVGISSVSPAAIHGTLQVQNANNLPGGTSGAIAWKGGGNKILIFGGTSLNNRRVNLLSNTLWEFDDNNNAWTWLNGSSGFIAAPQYGVRGVASVNNQPGARRLAATWKDKQGNFWMFGGLGFADSLSGGNLNDLWRYNPTSKAWTWVAGSSKLNQSGVYGTRGVAAPNNIPGGRYAAAGWVDTAGNIWIFGGNNGSGLFNDLWQYNPTTDRWTWMRGSNGGANNAQGVYGSKGVSAATNTPSAKEGTAYVVDKEGNLWLFGGRGISLSNEFGLMNDLWRFTPATTQWTWMGGSGTRNAPPFYGTQGIAGSGVPGGRQLAGLSLDADRNFYLFGGDGIDELGNQGALNDLWKYNVQSGQWTWLKGNTTRNILSVTGTKGIASNNNNPGGRTGSVLLTDGMGALWLFGGNGLGTTTGADFLQDLWKYDPASNNWAWIAGANTTFPAYQYGQKNIPSADNQPLARNATAAWYGNDGGLYFMGGLGRFNNQLNQINYNDLWKYQLPCAVKADFRIQNVIQCISGNAFEFTNTTTSVGAPVQYEWKTGDSAAATTTNFNFNFLKEGTYSVKLIARLGTCVDSITQQVQVLNTPVQLTASGNTEICSGQSITLKANSGNNLSYRWEKDGTEISQATDSLYSATEAGSYKVTVTNNLTGCSSQSGSITITIKSLPDVPTGNDNQVFCNKATIADLAATGTALKWYDAATGGNLLPANSDLENAKTYYATQTENGCESENRLAVTATVNKTTAPTGTATQSFCNAAKISDLSAVGTDLKWYDAATGGNILSSSNDLQNAGKYYVTQTLNNCESDTRLVVTVTINNTPVPTGNASQTFCNAAKTSDLSATGTNLKWYDAAFGGNTLNTIDDLKNAQIYYATQTENGCESETRLAITVTINNTPVPTGNAVQTFCNKAKISDLAATGTALKWYDAATGGNLLPANSNLENGKTYYATQTENGCESKSRLAVTATVNKTTAPAGNATQTFCKAAKISDLSATGTDLKWYDAETGGKILGGSTDLQSTVKYYATQTLNSCESDTRLVVTVTINNTLTPTGNATQTFCNTAKISDLAATGTDLKWYDAATGGNTLNTTDDLKNAQTYYATQTKNGCESENRLAVTATVNKTAAPTGNATQTFCNKATIADLAATGTTLKWYDAATGGNLLPANTDLENAKTYYATQTENGCESENRLAVTATVNKTAAPTGNATQSFCNAAKISDLSTTGTDLKWYDAEAAGNILNSNTDLQNAWKYYATQTMNNCESDTRLSVTVTINNTPLPTGDTTQTFCNAAKISDLSAMGTNLKWYDAASGGNQLSSSDSLQNGLTYYATQTLNGCESQNRLAISVTFNNTSAPTGADTQKLCSGANVSDLKATGNDIKWYLLASGGNSLNAGTVLQVGGTYYASQTINGCESPLRLPVQLELTQSPARPFISVSGVELVSSATFGNQWYADGIAIPDATRQTLQPTKSAAYSVIVTLNGCSSPASDNINFIVTSMNDLNAVAGEISIYPNPAVDYIQLNWNLQRAPQLNVVMLNTQGQRIADFSKLAPGSKIPVSSLSPGLYMLHLSTPDGKQKKVMKWVKG